MDEISQGESVEWEEESQRKNAAGPQKMKDETHQGEREMQESRCWSNRYLTLHSAFVLG